MAVVIRLQGLRITAGSEDIRRFFTGLKIPDGGVHIIGGERDEAFIIFASDEDARRAMTRSGGLIKGSPVTLLLSSKTEMQRELFERTSKNELDQKRRLEDDARHLRTSMGPEVGRRSGSRSGDTPPLQLQMGSSTDDLLYLFLRGLPFSVTENEVCEFFSGLVVDEIVLVKNHQGLNNGTALVKFATREDAMEGLKRDREYIGTRYVEISTTTANEWCRATDRMPSAVGNDNFERGRSPILHQRNPQHHVRSRSPVAQRHSPPSDEEYCVLLENLSFAVEKEDIKRLFRNAKLEDDQILFLTDADGKRTRSAFVLFKSLRDYYDALAHEKRTFFHRQLHARPISRENMISLLKPQSMDVQSSEKSQRFQERRPAYPTDSFHSEKICVLVRNLPFDVRKVEIIDFFYGFHITEDKVYVLRDRDGAGVGKALVVFGCEAEAMKALSLDGRRFLGLEIAVKSISRSEMQQLGFNPPVVREPLPREERYAGKSSDATYRPGDTSYPDFRIPRDGDIPASKVQDRTGSFDYEHRAVRSRSPRDRGNGVRGSIRSPVQHFDAPACVQLINLPFQIKSEEIYDFCYGYHIIPGSVSLQYDHSGKPKGSATLVFESRREALTAIEELSGRPIGERKIKLQLV